MALDNLIFDRTQADVDRAKYLASLWQNGTFTGTTEELAEWASELKGAYNASDLNRVLSAVEYLTDMLYDMGYNVPTVVPEKKTRYVAKQIEYIESTGTQYIDTGFKPNQDTRVIFDYYPVDTLDSVIFGSRTSISSSDKFFFMHAQNTNSLRTDFGSNDLNTRLNPTTRIEVDKNKNVTTIGENVFTNTASNFSSVNNIGLFCGNTGGTFKQNTKVRLYKCKIYDNGTLVRDYRPYISENGIACLYDAVNGEYIYNNGTGSFIPSEQPTVETAYWFDTDIPMQSQMDIYINNIQLLRDRLPYVAPNAPDSPTFLTYEQANNIEEILYNLERVLIAMQEAFLLRQANTLFMIAGGVFNNA